jgi:hypothetical protein
MYILYYLLFNTVYIKNIPTRFKLCLFIVWDSIVYYTSYRRMVLIKIYKLVDKMSLTVLSLWSLYLLLRVHHLFVSGVPLTN